MVVVMAVAETVGVVVIEAIGQETEDPVAMTTKRLYNTK